MLRPNKEKNMDGNFSIRLKIKDRNVLNMSKIKIKGYTVHRDLDLVTFGTFDKTVYESWVEEATVAGIWFESRSK